MKVMEGIIKQFDDECRILKCDMKNESEYEVLVRTKMSTEDCNSQCTDWINKFSAVTKTQWIVHQTYNNLKRLQFRKDFVCQHSSKNKTRKQDSTRSRNLKCPAKLIVKVKKCNKYTKLRDPLLKENLNTIIEVRFKQTKYQGTRHSFVQSIIHSFILKVFHKRCVKGGVLL